ncbi:MAG: siroheme synthase [Coriobacteriaceae bacterium]|nr:siroheme synthase [Coriobacteriaceae bacterium]
MAHEPKRFYPAFVDLTRRLAIVVGGGDVAERKVMTLVKCGADVAVIAPQVTTPINEMEAAGKLTVERREFVSGDLKGAFVVICATDSAEVNEAVFREAEGQGCLVNVVDKPELCNFIVPSIVRRGGLQIAVSTGGAAPALAKRLRRRLTEEFGPEWAEYIELLRQVRELVLDRVADEGRRKRILEALADRDDLREALAAGEYVDPDRVLMELVVDAKE